MKLTALTILTLISAATCSELVNTVDEQQQQLVQTAPNTPDSTVYTHNVGTHGDLDEYHSEITFAPKKIRAKKEESHNDPDHGFYSFASSSVTYLNSAGVQAKEALDIARNLDEEFLKHAVQAEEKKQVPSLENKETKEIEEID